MVSRARHIMEARPQWAENPRFLWLFLRFLLREASPPSLYTSREIPQYQSKIANHLDQHPESSSKTVHLGMDTATMCGSINS